MTNIQSIPILHRQPRSVLLAEFSHRCLGKSLPVDPEKKMKQLRQNEDRLTKQKKVKLVYLSGVCGGKSLPTGAETAGSIAAKCKFLQPFGHLLLSLTITINKKRAVKPHCIGFKECKCACPHLGQDCDQGASQLTIGLRVIERHCPPSVTAAASSPDTVHIFVYVVREVKVHHVLNIWNIQTAGSYRGCHQNWASAGAEVCKGLLSLSLFTVTARRNTMH